MRLAGRIAAAIDVLGMVLERHEPASQALKEWARSHRFAGSADRAAIGNLVFDTLRRRNSLAHRMASDTPRAIILATAFQSSGLSIEAFSEVLAEPHGPGALTEDERAGLARPVDVGSLPLAIRGDIPEWLAPSFERAFGANAPAEAAALAERAPVDLRVNTLKSSIDRVLKGLTKFGAEPGPLSPLCVRLAARSGAARSPNVEVENGYLRGWFEIQDAGSQVAALLVGAQPGMQVADICAGGGGKTLAMAASMQNRGQIFASDADRHRLKPIVERLQRAGARNVQVVPADEQERLDALAGRLDRVLVDAPCSGSGSWRRKPDAKWRLNPRQLALRCEEQRGLLDRGATLVRPGGRLIYVTCSLLPEENEEQFDAFLKRHPEFQPVDMAEVWRETIGTASPEMAVTGPGRLRLTPAQHASDGFFIGIAARNP